MTHTHTYEAHVRPRLARSSSLGLLVGALVFATAFFAGEPARAAAARTAAIGQVTSQQLLDATDTPDAPPVNVSVWPQPAAWPLTLEPVTFGGATPPAPPAGAVRVPVLMYHYIRINPVATDMLGFRLSVTPDNFAAQMAYLSRMGVHAVTFRQVLAAYAGGIPLPPRPVVLTFDDGHDDFATVAAPILAHFGFVATDYVVSGFLGRTSYMTAAQVRHVDTMGMIIGAHTVNHVELAKMPPAVALAEIGASKQMLEQLLGHSVRDFAYPYGSYNPTIEAMVQAAGFTDAVTTHSGLVFPGSDHYAFAREEVLGGQGLASFAALLSLPPPPAGFSAPSAASLIGH